MRFKGRHREAFACPRFQIAPAADDRAARAARQIVTMPTADGGASHRERR